MNKTIEKQISSGKEGSLCDFKQTYHQNNAALVHDIRCMVNTLHVRIHRRLEPEITNLFSEYTEFALQSAWI